jgi:hypothetical protein
MKTYLASDSNGEFKIEVPDSARLTFGPNVPYVKKVGYSSEDRGYALRIYDGSGTDKILACFCNVLWFRELTQIKVSRLVTNIF